MSERHDIETTYRGKRIVGQWYIEGGQLHVVSPLGRKSGPLVVGHSLPSELAVNLLWEIARKADPRRRLFYWPPSRFPAEPTAGADADTEPRGPLLSTSTEKLALIVLIIVGAFLAATILERFSDGWCREGGSRGYDCTYRPEGQD